MNMLRFAIFVLSLVFVGCGQEETEENRSSKEGSSTTRDLDSEKAKPKESSQDPRDQEQVDPEHAGATEPDTCKLTCIDSSPDNTAPFLPQEIVAIKRRGGTEEDGSTYEYEYPRYRIILRNDQSESMKTVRAALIESGTSQQDADGMSSSLELHFSGAEALTIDKPYAISSSFSGKSDTIRGSFQEYTATMEDGVTAIDSPIRPIGASSELIIKSLSNDRIRFVLNMTYQDLRTYDAVIDAKLDVIYDSFVPSQ